MSDAILDRRSRRLSLFIGFSTALIVALAGGLAIHFEHTAEARLSREKSQLEAEHAAEHVAGLLTNVEKVVSVMDDLPLPSIRSQAAFDGQVSDLWRLMAPGFNLQWAPRAVVRYIHPLAGNEQSVGDDLLADPDRREIVQYIISSGQPEWSRIHPLRQGGLGMVFRSPVFHQDAVAPAPTFAGLAIGTVVFPAALAALQEKKAALDLRIWIGVGEDAPVQVWGQASPLPDAATPSETMDGVAQINLAHKPDREHAPGPGAANGASAPKHALRVMVAARLLGFDYARNLHSHLLILAIIAALTGGLTCLTARAQLERNALMKLGSDLEQMKQVLDHSVTGKILFGMDGHALWANTKAMEVLHASHDQILSVNCFDHPLYAQNGWSALGRSTLQDGKSQVFEYCGEGAVGQPVDMRMSFDRIMIGDKPYLLAQVTDLAPAHAAERTLQQRSGELAAILGNASIGIALVRDRRQTWGNGCLAEMFGYRPEEMDGLDSRMLYPDDGSYEALGQAAYPILAQGGRFVRELPMRRRDGSRFWARLAGKLVSIDDPGQGSIWVIEDIDEQKQLEEELSDTNANLENLVQERTQALQQAKNFADSLLDTMGSVFVLLDTTGRIRRFNQAAQQITGFSFAELENQPIWESLIPPELQETVRGVFDDLLHNRLIGYFENEWLTKDGGRRLFAWHNTILHSFEGEIEHVMVTGIDITEQRANERELEQHRQHLEALVKQRTAELTQLQERYQTLFNESPDAYLLVTEASKAVTGCNLAAARMFGGTAERLLGMRLMELSPPTQPDGSLSSEAILPLINTCMRERHYEFEWVLRRLTGADFWAAVSVRVLVLNDKATAFIALRDIGERKRLEMQLQGTTRQLNSVLANTTVGVAHLKGRHIVWANSRAGEIFGYTREEMVGATTEKLYPGDGDFLFFGKEMYGYLAGGSSGTWERQMRHRAGHLFWCRLSARQIDPGQEEEGIIVVIEDITSRIDAEQKLVEAVRVAEEASLAKSVFLSNMSHEIRTPLNGVLGLLQLLEQTPLDATQASYVAKAYGTSRVLLNIISDILDVSRIEAGRIEIVPRPFALQAEVQSVLDTLAGAAADKGLALSVRYEPDCPDWLNGDALRIQQVLLNLGNNAIKFTEQGRIDFHIGCTPVDNGNTSLRFEVCDSGVGIPPAQLQRVFERFMQGDSSPTRRFGGAGLGLAIAKGLVDAMGGDIGVDSTPGQGSTFWFVLTLPACAAPAMAPAPTAIGTLDGLRILVAEDQEINQLVLMDMLAQLGARTTLAKNGSEAVAQVLAAGDTPFDAVLMDVEMPVMDGLAATRRLRQERGLARMPIIAVSAGVEKVNRQQCLAAGMNGFLAKPYARDDLYRLILHHCPNRVAPAIAPADDRAATKPPLPPVVEIPGLDLSGAIDRLGGDTAFYVRLATRFLGSLEDASQDLQARLRDTSADGTRKAVKALHGFRSGALTLGATGLSDLTRQMETTLADDAAANREQMQESLATALMRLRQDLQTTIDRLQKE